MRRSLLIAIAAAGCGGDPATGPADGGAGDGAGSDGLGGGGPTAQAILDRVAGCGGTAIKGGFGTDGPGAISMFACGGAVYWRADLDVDCDGIQTPPCDTDPTGQPQTSIVDLTPSGDVDPTLLPYFVIPLGLPESAWYEAHGIALGQVGAVVYGGQVRYGIFADEAGGWFIGEASYAMCRLFLGGPTGGGDPCSPIDGGIDASDVTYVTFTGATARATGAVIYDHAAHEALGVAAAEVWLRGP